MKLIQDSQRSEGADLWKYPGKIDVKLKAYRYALK
jgi:hypothetical protein